MNSTKNIGKTTNKENFISSLSCFQKKIMLDEYNKEEGPNVSKITSIK